MKKLARTFLLSCQDVFAELVAACNSHRLLLLPVSHSPGKRYTSYLVENGFRQISQQATGLGSTFVLASIFRECPILGRSTFQSRRCSRCVPVVSQCPEHHFLHSLFGVAEVSHVSQSLAIFKQLGRTHLWSCRDVLAEFVHLLVIYTVCCHFRSSVLQESIKYGISC